jgi:WD40 repeat protein
VESGHLLVTLNGHAFRVGRVAFSPEGNRIVTASDDKTARDWDAGTGTSLAVLTGHTAEVKDAEFAPDGKQIVTASLDKTARIWDAEAGRMLLLRGSTGSNSLRPFRPTVAESSPQGAIRPLAFGMQKAATFWPLSQDTQAGYCARRSSRTESIW